MMRTHHIIHRIGCRTHASAQKNRQLPFEGVFPNRNIRSRLAPSLQQFHRRPFVPHRIPDKRTGRQFSLKHCAGLAKVMSIPPSLCQQGNDAQPYRHGFMTMHAGIAGRKMPLVPEFPARTNQPQQAHPAAPFVGVTRYRRLPRRHTLQCRPQFPQTFQSDWRCPGSITSSQRIAIQNRAGLFERPFLAG